MDSGYLLGYSSTAKAYKVFNTRTKTVEETLNVKFNELSSLKIPSNPAELFEINLPLKTLLSRLTVQVHHQIKNSRLDMKL